MHSSQEEGGSNRTEVDVLAVRFPHEVDPFVKTWTDSSELQASDSHCLSRDWCPLPPSRIQSAAGRFFVHCRCPRIYHTANGAQRASQYALCHLLMAMH